MPYEDCEGDHGNDFSALLDQDCLLDLPPSLSVALLSIPFKRKIKEKSQTYSLASLEGFSPQHLQSLVLTTGLLKHNTGEVCPPHWEGLAEFGILFRFYDHDPKKHVNFVVCKFS